MILVRHEFVHRDAIPVAVGLHQNRRDPGGMAHFTRTCCSDGPSIFGVLNDRLNVLDAVEDGIVAIQVKLGYHAHSMGTTLTVPAAVS